MLIRKPGWELALGCDCCGAASPPARVLAVVLALARVDGWDPDPSDDGSGADRCPGCVAAGRWPARADFVRLAPAGDA